MSKTPPDLITWATDGGTTRLPRRRLSRGGSVKLHVTFCDWGPGADSKHRWSASTLLGADVVTGWGPTKNDALHNLLLEAKWGRVLFTEEIEVPCDGDIELAARIKRESTEERTK